MIAFKFLGARGVALYTGYAWPRGEWVEVEGPLEVCANGIHACRKNELAGWIDDELWLVELDGEIAEHDDVLVASRARLLQRVDAWDEAAARDFAESCVRRLRDQVASALALEGRAAESRRLAIPRDLGGVQRVAMELAERPAPPADELLRLLADTVELLRGGRPDAYESMLGPAAPVTAGAIAANLGFVTAHAFGRAAVGAANTTAAYARGYASERGRQHEWLRDRLALDEVVRA